MNSQNEYKESTFVIVIHHAQLLQSNMETSSFGINKKHHQ
jgi:hypothetical protein